MSTGNDNGKEYNSGQFYIITHIIYLFVYDTYLNIVIANLQMVRW